MQRFKCFALSAAMLILASAWAHAGSSFAQSKNEDLHNGQGYVFFAPGGVFEEGGHIGTLHIGGGGEALLYKGIGVGAEIGYLTFWKDFNAGIGILSANGSYHFMRDRKLSPFVTGGYTLGFRAGHVNLFNFGGGVNWWMSERYGMCFEFRDHVYRDDGESSHYLAGRIAFAFR
jgi:hypothetical protein